MIIRDAYYLIKRARDGGASAKEINVLYANLIARLRRASPHMLENFLHDDRVYGTISVLVNGFNYSEAEIEDIIVACFILNVKEGRNK